MSAMKKMQKKPRYTMGSDVAFMLDNAWKADRTLLFLLAAAVPMEAAVPVFAMYLPSRVVGLLESGAGLPELVGTILLLALGMLLCAAGGAWCVSRADNPHTIRVRMRLVFLGMRKQLTTDYPNGEREDFLQQVGKKQEVLNNNDRAGEETYRCLKRILVCVCSLVFYSGALWLLNPWILLAAALLTGLSFFARRASNNWIYRNRDNWTPYIRKMWYINEQAGNFKIAKDIRLFGMADWLKDLYRSFSQLRAGWGAKQGLVEFGADFCDALLTFLREGLAYAYLLYSVVTGTLGAADFVLYFAAIGNFSQQFLMLLSEFSTLHEMHLQLSEFRELLDYPEQFNRGVGAALPGPEEMPCSITLKNLHYRYPGAEKDTTCGLNVEIQKGEKIAIVGLNGAGKTTLIKLICGLYDPTEGEVLLNGIPVRSFNREEYYRLFSVVFQESSVLPVSIAANVGQSRTPDRARVEQALRLAGLWEKAASLPKGMDSRLMKSLYYDAVDLSGGEMQKLMLARALYKDAPVIILDEPTAALDPIAESELYEKYSSLTEGKTSFYISHRLASTRFCDCILFLEHGQVVEAGSHEELMAKRGKYFEMYEIQSAYYKKNLKKEGAGDGEEMEIL